MHAETFGASILNRPEVVTCLIFGLLRVIDESVFLVPLGWLMPLFSLKVNDGKVLIDGLSPDSDSKIKYVQVHITSNDTNDSGRISPM